MSRFAEEWISIWNRRDVEAALQHFADDVVFTSPTAARIVPASGGTIRGKDELRSYWNNALPMNPDLHFTLVGSYAGVATVSVHYRTQGGKLVVETFTFEDGLITTGHATHEQ